MSPPGRLTSKSKAVQHLRTLLSSGKLSGEEDPSFVHKADPVFTPYKLDNFRSAYNRIRRELALPKSREFGVVDLEAKCTADEEILPDTKRQKTTQEESNDAEVEYVEEENGEETHFDECFKPFYSFGMWEEAKTGTKRLSVAILLFSGVTADDFTVHVLPGGRVLEMRCAWPWVFTDVNVLHRRWFNLENGQQITDYHPKLNAFELFYRNLRERSSDEVYAVSRIRLPFIVETHILESHLLGWRESEAKGVYVELRSLREQYAITNEKKEFRIY